MPPFFLKNGGEMFRVAWQFVKKHWKSSLLLLIVFSFSMALLFLTRPLFDRAEQQIRTAYEMRYGAHHGAILHLDADKMQKLQASKVEVAYFQTYGSWRQPETGWQLTLGWFSEQAVSMGNLRLLEGRFPVGQDEIALEQNAVMFCCPEGTACGDIVTFEKDGQTRAFHLVGILADYVGNWDAVWGETVVPGYNDFPKGLLTKQELSAQTGVLVRFSQASALEGLDQVVALSQELNGGEELQDDIVLNQKLCYFPEEGIFQSFRLFRGMVATAIFIGVVMSSMLLLKVYLRGMQQSYRTLYLLGSGQGFAGRLYALQCMGILLTSVLAAIGLAQGVFWMLGGGTVLYPENLLWPGLTALGIAGLMLLAFRTQIVPMASRSLSHGKRSSKAQGVDAKRMMGVLLESFVYANFKKVLPVLCVIAMLVSSFGIAGVYANQFREEAEVQLPDFSMNINDPGYIRAAGYAVHAYRANVFDLNGMLALYEDPDIVALEERFLVDASWVLPTERSAYWNSFAGTAESEIPEESLSILSEEGGTVLGEENWNFYVKVIPEGEEAAYLQAYPDLPLETMKERGSAALILPPVETLHYDAVETGGMLRFISLSYPDDLSLREVMQRPEVLSAEEKTISIAYITEEAREVGKDRLYSHRPTVLLAQKTAVESGFVRGGEQLFLTLREGISEEGYARVQKKLRELGAGVSGASIYSLREDREQNRQLMQVVEFSLEMILGVFGVFAVIAIYSALYMTILQRKRSLAIYRALGLPRWKLVMAMLIELLFYWLLAILGAFLLGMLVFHGIWDIRNFFYLQMGLPLMRSLLLALLTGLPLNGFIVWLLQRNIYSESVYAAIRLGE